MSRRGSPARRMSRSPTPVAPRTRVPGSASRPAPTRCTTSGRTADPHGDDPGGAGNGGSPIRRHVDELVKRSTEEVFKGFDSDPAGHAQPLHNSIDLPAEGAAPRVSVEPRFFAFFE